MKSLLLIPGSQIINIICYTSLAVWNIPEGWRWTCYILSGGGYGLSGLCMALVTSCHLSKVVQRENDGLNPCRWAHEICADDNEERAIVIASMNEMAYVLQAWLPLIVWQQVDAPEYRKGFITVTCLSVALISVGIATKVLHRRQIARCVRLLQIEPSYLLKPFNSRTQGGVDKNEVRRREGSEHVAVEVEVHAAGKV